MAPYNNYKIRLFSGLNSSRLENGVGVIVKESVMMNQI